MFIHVVLLPLQGVITARIHTQGVLAPLCSASVSYVAERPWAICFCPFRARCRGVYAFALLGRVAVGYMLLPFLAPMPYASVLQGRAQGAFLQH